MTYEPQVNDYVKWKNGVEGWVYFKCEEYITIEHSVRPKDELNYLACSIHKNDRLLVICYHQQYDELEYIDSRKTIHQRRIPTFSSIKGARPNCSTNVSDKRTMDSFDDIQIEDFSSFDLVEEMNEGLFEEENDDKSFNTFLNSNCDF